jgi:uncharacterized protein (DUF4415 family)
MTRSGKIPDSDEAWDSGQLGRAAEHARPAAGDIEKTIDASLGLQLISIRLQKSLIDDFKSIAALNGIGYQPLMRQILKRFVDGEKRRMARERVADRRAAALRGK